MTLQTWLEENPFTLALSSGFFGFFAHVGFVKALAENGLSPKAFTGSSAGAIVGSAAALGMSAKDIERLVLGVSRTDFWDPAPGLGVIRGKKFERLVESKIGNDFSVLTKPLRIATFDILKRKTAIFSKGNLARAVRASSSVPVMFHPVYIEGRYYWDGGVLDKMGLEGVPSDENVLGHYLQGDSRYEAYERRRDDKKWSNPTDGDKKSGACHRKIITLKDLPRSGPYKMHLGPEIIEGAYRQTLAHLKSNVAPSCLL